MLPPSTSTTTPRRAAVRSEVPRGRRLLQQRPWAVVRRPAAPSNASAGSARSQLPPKPIVQQPMGARKMSGGCGHGRSVCRLTVCGCAAHHAQPQSADERNPNESATATSLARRYCQHRTHKLSPSAVSESYDWLSGSSRADLAFTGPTPRSSSVKNPTEQTSGPHLMQRSNRRRDLDGRWRECAENTSSALTRAVSDSRTETTRQRS